MNKTLILLLISLAVLVLSVICVTVAPIINDLLGNFTSWGKNNCQYFSDVAKYTKELDDKYKNEKYNNLCIRQKAMYGLEYSAFIFDLAIGFLIGQLALLHYFNAGKSFEKTTGLIGLIGGGIGFLITLIYVCFSGYIFNNDVAYRTLDSDSKALIRLYSNGAYSKPDGTTIFANEIDDDAQYVKYKDLGCEQYNYNKKFYEAYSDTNRINCQTSASFTCSSSNCDYCYPSYTNSIPNYSSLSLVSNDNKYLYDRWCLSLVLAVIITVLNAGIVVFGLLLFLNKGGDSGDAKPVEIK